MIRVDWRDPNFVCEVEDLHGKRWPEIHHAASQAELETRLQARIDAGTIRAFHSVEAYNFAAWRAKADRETARAIAARAAGNEYEFKATIWQELKPYLIQLFLRKCAYCEAEYRSVAWGDVEHYRPKGRVTDEQDRPVVQDSGEEHPGYYWLAYNYTNLMPACQRCNQAGAKLDRFPLDAKGKRACCPTDPLNEERPLLLNPYTDDVLTHLKFVPRVGTVAGAPGAGEVSVRFYALNREDLVDDRRSEQQSARQAIKQGLVNENAGELIETKRQYAVGRRRFSRAALAEIEDYEQRMGIRISV